MEYKINYNLCFHPKKLMILERTLIDEYVKKENGIIKFIDYALEECKNDKNKSKQFDEQLRIEAARKLRLKVIEEHGDEVKEQICGSCKDNYICKPYQNYKIKNLETTTP
ncbi:MAG: hypothetical protein Q7S33_00715 [Nanoarchaeota archaeon]|nr:hypothetical protein [Nanoarchaeota archaeon]